MFFRVLPFFRWPPPHVWMSIYTPRWKCKQKYADKFHPRRATWTTSSNNYIPLLLDLIVLSACKTDMTALSHFAVVRNSRRWHAIVTWLQVLTPSRQFPKWSNILKRNHNISVCPMGTSQWDKEQPWLLTASLKVWLSLPRVKAFFSPSRHFPPFLKVIRQLCGRVLVHSQASLDAVY